MIFLYEYIYMNTLLLFVIGFLIILHLSYNEYFDTIVFTGPRSEYSYDISTFNDFHSFSSQTETLEKIILYLKNKMNENKSIIIFNEKESITRYRKINEIKPIIDELIKCINKWQHNLYVLKVFNIIEISTNEQVKLTFDLKVEYSDLFNQIINVIFIFNKNDNTVYLDTFKLVKK